jgi:hypothetical protein
MKNINELQQKLSEMFDGVESESIDFKKAKLMSDIAGKMISAHATQIKYYGMRKEKPRIAFLSTRGNSDESV